MGGPLIISSAVRSSAGMCGSLHYTSSQCGHTFRSAGSVRLVRLLPATFRNPFGVVLQGPPQVPVAQVQLLLCTFPRFIDPAATGFLASHLASTARSRADILLTASSAAATWPAVAAEPIPPLVALDCIHSARVAAGILAVGVGLLQLPTSALLTTSFAPRRRAPPSNFSSAAGRWRGAVAALRPPLLLLTHILMLSMLALAGDVDAIPEDSLAGEVQPGWRSQPGRSSHALVPLALLLSVAAAPPTPSRMVGGVVGQARRTASSSVRVARSAAGVNPRPSPRAFIASIHMTTSVTLKTRPNRTTAVNRSNQSLIQAGPTLGTTRSQSSHWCQLLSPFTIIIMCVLCVRTVWPSLFTMRFIGVVALMTIVT